MLCLSIQLSQSLAAAAAKSVQSCPTLCDPIDGSPPGSPIPGILQARTLEWVAISFSKVSRLVVSNSLRPHGLQHTGLSCPSSTHGAYSNSWPSSLWCHSIISFSIVPFSSHLQSFPWVSSWHRVAKVLEFQLQH